MQSEQDNKEPKMMFRLASLLLSLLLWVNFSGRVDVTQTAKQRVFQSTLLTYVNAPENIEIVDNQSVLLHVTVTGPDKELEALNSTDLQASLNLELAQRGVRTFPLTKDNITLPTRFKELEVVSVIPDRVSLTLEHMASKRLKLRLDVNGLVAADYEVLEEKTIPEEVTIRGPSNRVEDMTLLLSRTVSVEGANQTLEGPFQIANDLPRDAFLIENLSSLRYKIVIAERKRTAKAPTSYNLLTKVAEGEEDQWKNWKIPKKKVTLSYTGPVSLVRWFDPTWVSPVAQISTVTARFPEPDPKQSGANGKEAVATGAESVVFTINNVWNVPEEIQKQYPNWLEQVSKLDLIWNPQQLEVSRK